MLPPEVELLAEPPVVPCGLLMLPLAEFVEVALVPVFPPCTPELTLDPAVAPDTPLPLPAVPVLPVPAPPLPLLAPPADTPPPAWPKTGDIVATTMKMPE